MRIISIQKVASLFIITVCTTKNAHMIDKSACQYPKYMQQYKKRYYIEEIKNELPLYIGSLTTVWRSVI